MNAISSSTQVWSGASRVAKKPAQQQGSQSQTPTASAPKDNDDAAKALAASLDALNATGNEGRKLNTYA